MVTKPLQLRPDDDWAEPRRIVRDYPEESDRTAFLLIRPDAVCQGLVPAILSRVEGLGLVVADALVVQPHVRQPEELYRYTQVRLMMAKNRPMWWYMPRYYRLGPAVVVLLSGEPATGSASELLASVKGPSNPALTRPGQLRFDFGSQNMVMCTVHSSDVTETAIREGCLFFGAERVRKTLATGGQGFSDPRRRRTAIDALCASAGIPTTPSRRPVFHQVLAGLQAALLREVRLPTDAWQARDHTIAALRDGAEHGLADAVYERRTSALRAIWDSDEARFLVGQLDTTDDLGAFLAWSSSLSGTGGALMDLVLDRLKARGIEIDLWSEVVLETGFGFHDLIAQRFTPTTDDTELARSDLASAEALPG